MIVITSKGSSDMRMVGDSDIGKFFEELKAVRYKKIVSNYDWLQRVESLQANLFQHLKLEPFTFGSRLAMSK